MREEEGEVHMDMLIKHRNQTMHRSHQRQEETILCFSDSSAMPDNKHEDDIAR